MKKNIYLDYAANTPVDPEVLKTFNVKQPLNTLQTLIQHMN